MQKVAFVLIGIGVLVLIGWSVRAFFTAADIPIFIRIGVGAIGAGILVLLGSVIKDRRFQGGRQVIITTSDHIQGKASGQGHYGRVEGYGGWRDNRIYQDDG